MESLYLTFLFLGLLSHSLTLFWFLYAFSVEVLAASSIPLSSFAKGAHIMGKSVRQREKCMRNLIPECVASLYFDSFSKPAFFLFTFQSPRVVAFCIFSRGFITSGIYGLYWAYYILDRTATLQTWCAPQLVLMFMSTEEDSVGLRPRPLRRRCWLTGSGICEGSVIWLVLEVLEKLQTDFSNGSWDKLLLPAWKRESGITLIGGFWARKWHDLMYVLR